MARDAPRAIVLLRGPSAWAHLIGRNTDDDTFTHGAWLRGRIYESKCDLSPDGELFLYAVHQGSRSGPDYTQSWTALSRAPWLHALVVWPMGTTYGGGGRFVGSRRVALRGVSGVHPSFDTQGIEVVDEPAPYVESSREVEGAAWCGRDRRGRIVFAREGRLFARREDRDVELADLNGLRPDPQPPPEWAKVALGRRKRLT